MSVAGILSSAVFSLGAHLFQNRTQKMHSEFQQLGQDLQSGNLSAAQADFATLQQLQGQSGSSSSAQSTSTITQDFNQLAADLKAGNLTAAQKDFTAIQNDLQKRIQVPGWASAFNPSTENAESASTAVGSTRNTTSQAVGGRSSGRIFLMESSNHQEDLTSEDLSERTGGLRRWNPPMIQG